MIVRRSGLRQTNAIPCRISATRLGRSAVRSDRSGRRTRASEAAESAKVAASMAIVVAGPIAATSRPAIAGPMMNGTLSVASIALFARPRFARPTRAGTALVKPLSERTRRAFIGNAKSRMTAIVGPPSQSDSGIAQVSAARPASAHIIIRRRSQRSARAPAGRPRRRSGRSWSAPTMPMRAPEPVRKRTSSGIAVNVIASPRADTACPVRTITKSRLFRRGRPGHSATAVIPRLRRYERVRSSRP